jgi:hypothetical protein
MLIRFKTKQIKGKLFLKIDFNVSDKAVKKIQSIRDPVGHDRLH